ncbi:MAG: hypothetical protein N4A35_12250 [Flavobacteriales bacterium]|jgi:hypothetical protein|nr:hypothetical protein [Flavobacteriales bacterium]
MRFSLTENRWSLFIALAVILYICTWPFYNYWLNPFTWDTFGYYLYLPMSLIHNDLGISDFSILEEVKREQFISPTFYQINKTETGHWLIRYPMGLAVLHAPFFGIGHFFAKGLGYAQNGFSLPYQIAITSGSLFYISSSVLLLRKILLRWFKDHVVAVTLLLLFLGTNIISQITVSATMPHAILFFVYTLIVYLTIKWHENKSLTNSVLLGGVIGLAVISRPTEVVAVLIPLLWEVKNWDGFKEKVAAIWSKHRKHLLLAVIVAFGVISLQLIYWKTYTGHFVYNSYNNVGEGLDLLAPHTLNVLFSFKKGWLIYTPMMLLAIGGFYFLKKEKPTYFLSFFSFFVLNLYLVSSWTCWWYAASFGQRALVQSYVVMAIALAFFIQALLKMKILPKTVGAIFVILFLGLNLFQNYQFRLGIIHGHRMTAAYYQAVFGRLDVQPNELEHLLSFNRDLTFEESLKNYRYDVEQVYKNGFESDENVTTEAFKHSGKKALVMNETAPFSKDYAATYSNLTTEEYCWIEVRFWAYLTHSDANVNLVNTIVRSGDNYGYSANNLILDAHNVEVNKWKEYVFHYQTPHIRSGSDEFKSYFWYCGGGEVYIDDLTITKYTPK